LGKLEVTNEEEGIAGWTTFCCLKKKIRVGFHGNANSPTFSHGNKGSYGKLLHSHEPLYPEIVFLHLITNTGKPFPHHVFPRMSFLNLKQTPLVYIENC